MSQQRGSTLDSLSHVTQHCKKAQYHFQLPQILVDISSSRSVLSVSAPNSIRKVENILVTVMSFKVRLGVSFASSLTRRKVHVVFSLEKHVNCYIQIKSLMENKTLQITQQTYQLIPGMHRKQSIFPNPKLIKKKKKR